MSSATLQASTATVIAVAAGSAACAALITYQLLQRRSSARAQVDESPSTSGAPAAAESRGFSCRRDLFGQEQAPLTPLPALAAPGTVQSPINFKKRQDPYDPTPRAGYLSWDDYFMAVAFLSAERSKDPNKQVGACIVNQSQVILAIGYNGFPRGCPDAALPWAKKSAAGDPLETKYPYVVHAEANALLNKNEASVKGAKLYVTMFPCNECAKLLIQAGIGEVVFAEDKIAATAVPTPSHAGLDLEASNGSPSTSFSAAQRLTSEEQQRQQQQQQQQQQQLQQCCSVSGGCNGGSSTAAARSRLAGGASPSEGAPDGAQRPASGKQGAGQEIDATYVASRRLLQLAGVKLRQHRLQRPIYIVP